MMKWADRIFRAVVSPIVRLNIRSRFHYGGGRDNSSSGDGPRTICDPRPIESSRTWPGRHARIHSPHLRLRQHPKPGHPRGSLRPDRPAGAPRRLQERVEAGRDSGRSSGPTTRAASTSASTGRRWSSTPRRSGTDGSRSRTSPGSSSGRSSAGEILDDLLIADSCLNNPTCPHRRPRARWDGCDAIETGQNGGRGPRGGPRGEGRAGRIVGLVPTMGALHDGHIRLDRAMPGRVGLRGRLDLRQPDPVRPDRGLRAIPADPGSRPPPLRGGRGRPGLRARGADDVPAIGTAIDLRRGAGPVRTSWKGRAGPAISGAWRRSS